MLMQAMRTGSSEKPARTSRVIGHLGLWLGYILLALALHLAHAWVSSLLLFSVVILMPLGEPLLMAAGISPKREPVHFFHYLLLANALVAAGITLTHFGRLAWVEPVGVAVLVLGALGVALSQMKLGFQKKHLGWTRSAFVFSGLSLFIAMLLALGFGVRYFMSSLALTMPQMWAVHGSLNAFGFGLLGILAWRSSEIRDQQHQLD
jgi:hypothetical protein